MIQVNSFTDLTTRIKDKEKAYLLIYKKGSDKSDCAFQNIVGGAKDVKGIELYSTDVITTRDIHIHYGITSTPSLLELEKGVLKNLIKGCNETKHYKALFEDAVFLPKTKYNEKPLIRVTVYSTPSCSWCTTLKNYLKQHTVQFTDIDVSANQRAADELVKRSGQMGVPQTVINGEIIVGFNKARINELLNIRG